MLMSLNELGINNFDYQYLNLVFIDFYCNHDTKKVNS